MTKIAVIIGGVLLLAGAALAGGFSSLGSSKTPTTAGATAQAPATATTTAPVAVAVAVTTATPATAAVAGTTRAGP